MKRMTRWGIGPKWVACCILCTVPVIVVDTMWSDVLAIHLVSRPILFVAGCLLLAVGVPFSVSALWILHRGFSRGELFTGGVYGLCRHPIYAGLIVFLVPGVLLLRGSWAFLLVPAVMYTWLRFFVREEEALLEAEFRDEYRVYRQRVPAVLPVPRFWKHPGGEGESSS